MRAWLDGEGASDPNPGPFEPSDDVRWFSREMTDDLPPVWSPDREPQAGPHPDRVVVVTLEPATARETLELVYGAAAKYDLVVYDPQRQSVHQPLAEMAAYASATLWPRGAIQAAVAGAAGAAIAAVAWVLNIPIVSGIAIIVGAFLFVMAVYTFVHEGRKRVGSRRSSQSGAGGP